MPAPNNTTQLLPNTPRTNKQTQHSHARAAEHSVSNESSKWLCCPADGRPHEALPLAASGVVERQRNSNTLWDLWQQQRQEEEEAAQMGRQHRTQRRTTAQDTDTCGAMHQATRTERDCTCKQFLEPALDCCFDLSCPAGQQTQPVQPHSVLPVTHVVQRDGDSNDNAGGWGRKGCGKGGDTLGLQQGHRQAAGGGTQAAHVVVYTTMSVLGVA